MAEDIVKIRYDVQLAELQGALKQTLEPLKKIDETANKTNTTMVKGAKEASVEYKKMANAVSDTVKASRQAEGASDSLSKTILEQKKFLIELEKELIRVEQLRANATKTDYQSIIALDKQTKHLKSSIKDQRISLRELALQKTSTAKATDGLTGANKNLTKGNGLANQSAIEFGRTLSDAPYGIRGVANNIQQLGSNLAQLKNQTGSSKLAFKALLGSFAGPLGFLVLFQGAIALLDHFYGGMKKGEEEVDKMTDAIDSQALQLQSLAEIYSNANAPLDVRKKAFKDLQKELPILSGLEFGNADAINAVNSAVAKNIELSIKRRLVSKYMDELVDVESSLLQIQEDRAGAQEYIEKLNATSDQRIAGVVKSSQEQEELDTRSYILKEKINILNTEAIRIENLLGLNRKKESESNKNNKKELEEILKVKSAIANFLGMADATDDEIERLEEADRVLKEYQETAEFGNEGMLKLIQENTKAEDKEYQTRLENEEKYFEAKGKLVDDNSLKEAQSYKKSEEEQRASLQRQVQIQSQFAIAVGQNFDVLFSDQEDKNEAFLKATLVTLLQFLRSYMIAQVAQATIGSLASAQSIATGGIAGVTQAAILTGLIEAAFQIAKGGVENFHDGSEFVNGKRGRDKIPAMIEYGERVVPTETNRMLGGITNKELPNAVQYYEKMKGKGFADQLSGSLNLNAALNDKGIIGSNGSIENQIRGLRKDLRRNRSNRNGF
jgi:hypothetical protein